MMPRVSLFCVFLCIVMSEGRITSPPGVNTHDTGCPAEFKSVCHCGYVPYGPNSKQTYVTNCTNTAFSDSDMLKHLPIETEVLIFTGNDIYDLHFNIFGRSNTYSRLHTVDLSENHIQTIKGRTFHNVNSVRKLILNDNDLYLIGKDNHPRMFSNFLSLEELHLRNAFTKKDVQEKSSLYVTNLAETFRESQLTKLKILDLSDNGMSETSKDSDIFCSLTSLEKLYLSDSKIADFDQNLSCLTHLSMLDLSNNYLHVLSNATRSRITETSGLKVNLSGNPFRCDCDLQDTYLWLLKHSTRLTNRQNFVCNDGYPQINVGRELFELETNELKCPIELQSFQGHLQISYIVLALILVVFALLIGVFGFRNRNTMKALAVRLTEPLRTKLSYSSLDRRDVVEAEMEV